MTDKYFEQIAPIWEEWFRTRNAFMKMSIKEREELLQVHRDQLQKELLNKPTVDDTELFKLIELKKKQREEQQVNDLFKEWKNK